MPGKTKLNGQCISYQHSASIMYDKTRPSQGGCDHISHIPLNLPSLCITCG